MTNTENADRGVCKLDGCSVVHRRGSAIGNKHAADAAFMAQNEPVDTGACAECGSVHGHAEFCSAVVEPDASTEDGAEVDAQIEADEAAAVDPADKAACAAHDAAVMAGYDQTDPFDATESSYFAVDGFGTRDYPERAAVDVLAEGPDTFQDRADERNRLDMAELASAQTAYTVHAHDGALLWEGLDRRDALDAIPPEGAVLKTHSPAPVQTCVDCGVQAGRTHHTWCGVAGQLHEDG